MHRNRYQGYERDDDQYEGRNTDREPRERGEEWRMGGRYGRGERYGQPDEDERERYRGYESRGGRERWRFEGRPDEQGWGRQYGRHGEPEGMETEAWGGGGMSGYYGPREGYGMQRGGIGRGGEGERWRMGGRDGGMGGRETWGRGGMQEEGGDTWRSGMGRGRGSDGGDTWRSGSGRGGLGNEGRESFRGRGPKGFTRSDDRIREQVCDLLEDDDELDASEIEVNVRNGEVTLEGQVDGRRAKRLAEDIVCSVRGVKECQNHLRTSGMRSQQQQQQGRGQETTSNGGARRSEQVTR